MRKDAFGMKQRQLKLLSLAAAAVGIGLAGQPATADIGFKFLYSGLTLSYDRSATDGSALGLGTVGTLTIGLPTTLEIRQFNTGPDGRLGGSDDVFLDSVRIDGGANMLLSVSMDVVRLGTNIYRMEGTATGTDLSTATNSHEAAVKVDNSSVSSYITYYDPIGGIGGGHFSFAGLAYTLAGNDAILVNRALLGSDWVFTGQGPVMAGDPDADSSSTTLRLDTGRLNYDRGSLAFFDIDVDAGFGNLDGWFSYDQSETAGQLQLNVIPTPAAVTLGLIGLGLACCIRRR